MRRTCPECRTTAGSRATYCIACGYSYPSDPVRDVVRDQGKRPGISYKAAVITGLVVAVAQYLLLR